MAYNPKNSIRQDTGNGGLLSQGELAQGNENTAQNAQNVTPVDDTGVPYSGSNPFPVTLDAPSTGKVFVDGSGTISSGGVSQQIFAANTARVYLFVNNTSDTVMYLGIGTAAVAGQPSITLIPNGGYYEPLVAPSQTVNIICASSGKTLVAKQA